MSLPLERKAGDTRETCYQETFGYRCTTISDFSFKRGFHSSSKDAAALSFAPKKESPTGLLFYSFTSTFSIAPMYMVWKFPASFPSYQRFSIDGSRKVLSSSFV